MSPRPIKKIRGLKLAVRRHVLAAVSRIDPARYHQEPAYVSALLARLDDVVLDRSDVRIEIRSLIVADRGRDSAESIWGADFGLTASLGQREVQIDKGVLGQAKRAVLTALPPRDEEDFRQQVAKMASVTSAVVGLEVPSAVGVVPLIRIVEATSTYGENWAAQSVLAPQRRPEHVIRPKSPSDGPAVLIWYSLPFDAYLSDHVVGCSHGDRDPRLVQALEHSNLPRLHINVQTTP